MTAAGEDRPGATAALGHRRVEWADVNMPVLSSLRRGLESARPLAGVTVGACLHITAETATMLRTLRTLGAQVSACAANPLSTQDDVVAALAGNEGISVHAERGEDHRSYYAHIDAVLASVIDGSRSITLDDGCDLVSRLHQSRPDGTASVVGGTEETTSGVVRLRAMERAGALRYPMVAVNDAPTKHLFDNRHGTGQSTLDGIIRATNVLVAGKTMVVAGFGDCGKGVAARARGLGAEVVVTEVDPLRALEAALDGFRVLPMIDAAREGDIFVTVTGNRDVIRGEHFVLMKDGAVLANSGHFDVEINIPALEAMAGGRRATVRPALEQFDLTAEDPGAARRRVLLVGEGRVVNLAAAEGHPAAVMDLSFATQVMTVLWLLEHEGELERRVYGTPPEVDGAIARLKLETMGISLDALSEGQRDYLSAWTLGT